jgi:hypothetical protein
MLSANSAARSQRRSEPRCGIPVRLRHGYQKIDALVIEASPYDIRATTLLPTAIGQKTGVCWRSEYLAIDIEIPGLVHSVYTTGTKTEIGIATRQCLPDELLFDGSGVQRTSIRFQCRVPGRVSLPGVTGTVSALVLNYSRRGMCLQVNAVPKAGDTIQFLMGEESGRTKMPPGKLREKMEAVVRWVSAGKDSSLIGCSLTNDYGYKLSGVDLQSSFSFRRS